MVPVIVPTWYAWYLADLAVSICRQLLSLEGCMPVHFLASQTGLLLLRSTHVNVAWSGLVVLYFTMGGLIWSVWSGL